MNNRIQLEILRFPGLIVLILIALAGCGPEPVDNQLDPNFHKLSQEQKDFIERFNVIAKDVRDYPKAGKDIDRYFRIWHSTAKLEDARILFFGETHTHSASQIWTAGIINRLIRPGDVVLFEGAQAGTQVTDITEQIIVHIFAAREYEKLKTDERYKALSLSKIIRKFIALYVATKQFLTLKMFKYNQAKGYFWDLVDASGKNLHADMAKRNKAMVESIKATLTHENRVFVITGAGHIPHFDFARTLAHIEKAEREAFKLTPGVDLRKIDDVFYTYFAAHPPAKPKLAEISAKTKVIFDYLKGQDFAVFLPKNMPAYSGYEEYFPANAK